MFNSSSPRSLGRQPNSHPAIGVALCLMVAASPLAAQEVHRQIEVIHRPVVVVSSGEHHSVQAWSYDGSRSFLGVQTLDMTPELRRHFGVPEDVGVLVARIIDDSPAASSELKVGDILTALDGEAVGSLSGLARSVGERESGETVVLEIWRDGHVRSIQTVLAERQGPRVDIRQFRFPDSEQFEIRAWSDDELQGAIELETETLNRAIDRLNDELNSPEWEQRIYRFQEHHGGLMERIELLEEQLEKLEDELRHLPDRD